LGPNCSIYYQYLPSTWIVAPSWSSHYPVRVEHFPNVEVQAMLCRLPGHICCRRVLSHANPDSQGLRMGGQPCGLAEPAGHIHYHGSICQFSAKLCGLDFRISRGCSEPRYHYTGPRHWRVPTNHPLHWASEVRQWSCRCHKWLAVRRLGICWRSVVCGILS